MALFNVFHETEADSAYDKGPIRYFDAYRLKNKGGASYHHFFDSIHTYIYIYIYIYIFSIRYIHFFIFFCKIFSQSEEQQRTVKALTEIEQL